MFTGTGTPGLGGSVVMNLLAPMSQQQYLSVYIDNFFTSLNLLDQLKERNWNNQNKSPANVRCLMQTK